jgi:hypothetical protein
MERWVRAKEMGLEPPVEVHVYFLTQNHWLMLAKIKEILESRQGVEDDTYKQCILYGEV